jgi:hypothetical protein
MQGIAIQDLEAGIDALADLFLSYEFSKVLEEEYARQAVKIPMRVIAVAYPDEVQTLDAYPAVEVIAANDEDEDEASQANKLRHEISVQFTVNGDNPITMARELKRLVKATRRVFNDKIGTLAPEVGGRFWASRVDFSETVTGRDQPFLKSAAVRVYWLTHGY